MEDIELLRKRLRYQSWYRGCKETDRILGQFAAVALDTMDREELERFATILDEQDMDIYAWIVGRKPMPVEYRDCPVMQAILAFDVPAALRTQASPRT